MRHLAILGIILSLAAPAAASTPQAWKQLQRQAERTCIQASAFARPRVSSMIVFDDATGKVALLVSGTYRPAHMKGATGTSLCLYDRRSKKAAVEEAKGWRELR